MWWGARSGGNRMGQLAVLMVALPGAVACSQGAVDDPSVIAAVCLTHNGGEWGVPDPSLCTVDLETGKRSIVVPAIAGGEPVSLSPDRSRVAYIDVDSQLSVVSVDGSEGPDVVLRSVVSGPVWIDDSHVAIIDAPRRTVSQVNLDDGTRGRVLVDLHAVDDSVDLELIRQFQLRDETILLATSIGPDQSEESTSSLLLRHDGGWMRLMPHGGPDAWAADIHPYDNVIAVNLDADLHVIDFGGNHVAQVSPTEWVATSPKWSPSGQQLVWVAEAVDRVYGTAVLFTASWPLDDSENIRAIVGNNHRPFEQLPVFPDW